MTLAAVLPSLRTRSVVTAPAASLGVSATGVATYRSDYVTSDGEPVPSPFQLALAADGTITVPSNGAHRGTMSLTKDTYVRTTSHGVPGRYGISIVMKR